MSRINSTLTSESFETSLKFWGKGREHLSSIWVGEGGFTVRCSGDSISGRCFIIFVLFLGFTSPCFLDFEGSEGLRGAGGWEVFGARLVSVDLLASRD